MRSSKARGQSAFVPRAVSSRRIRTFGPVAILTVLSFASACLPGPGPGPKDDASAGRSFRTPEAAADALVEAASARDNARLKDILGPDSEDLISSGDAVADETAAANFVAAATKQRAIVKDGRDFATLEIGDDQWEFPIPLVRTRAGWHFDTAAGRDELLTRRIGRNELAAINSSLAYVDAQRDYAARLRAAGRRVEYAQKINSTPGRRDGLFWEVRNGERESPLGPLFALSDKEGYALSDPDAGPQPFHGYFFRVLTSQGPAAPGGRKSYIYRGHMTGGFALVAWPAEYGNSGVMTFLVNQLGVVFQKDLGENTAEAVAAMDGYDPDDSWDPVEPVLDVDVADVTD